MPAAGAAGPRVLFESGDTARDGVVLFGPRSLASDGGRVAFMGDAAAILIRSGDVYTVVVRGGDPLPPPASGTFVTPSMPVVNDAGQVLFTARRVLYLWSAGTPVRVASAVLASDLNDAGQAAYATRDRVFLSSGGEPVELTPKGTLPAGRVRLRSSTRRSLVLSDDGSVALVAQVLVLQGGRRRWRDAVVVASAGAEPKVVAVERDPSPNGADYAFSPRTPLSINASGQLAFVGGGVFVWDPGTGDVTAVAGAGDLVDGEALTGFGGFVGIDSHGTVAFAGRFGTGGSAVSRLVRAAGGTLSILAGDDDGRGTFAPRLTDAGDVVRARAGHVDRLTGATVTPISGPETAAPFGPGFMADAPSINDAGAVAFATHRGGVYLLGSGPPEPVLTEGETAGDGSVISSISDYAFGGGRVAALTSGADEGALLVTRTLGGPLVGLVHDGDPTPLGGTFDLGEALPKLDRRGVVFAADVVGGNASSGIFLADFDGTRIDVVVPAGRRVKGGHVLDSVSGPAPLARGVVFQATLDGEDDAEGLFVARGRRVRRIAASGERAPGGGRFRSFGPPTADRSRVLFEAAIGRRRGADTAGLFLWSPRGGLALVARDRTRVRGGGRVRPLEDFGDVGPYAFGFRGVVFSGPFAARGLATDALFLGRCGRPRRLFPAGDPTAVSPVAIGDFTVAGREVVLVTRTPPSAQSPDTIVAVAP